MRVLRPSLIATGVLALLSGASGSARTQPPIAIEKIGSFEVGGDVVSDGNGGTLSCDHGFVDYLIPAHRRQVALMLWHSSSTRVWQNRWDGGEGYVSLFLRRGYPIYLWDGPRVGRANWSCAPTSFTPRPGQDQKNFVAWRFGSSYPNWFPGVQFPTHDKAAWDQATRARYDEYDTIENIDLQARAAAQAIDRIGPVAIVTNSAGGIRAMLAATEAKTGSVRAIIAYENPAFVLPEDDEPKMKAGPYGPKYVSVAAFRKLAVIPIQLVWGDHTDSTPGWTAAVAQSRHFVEVVRRYGGHAEILALPAAGLQGNTHLAFADMNNVAVAKLMSDFLRRQHLDARRTGSRR